MTYTPDQWEQIIASGIEAAGGGGGGGGTIMLTTSYDSDADAYTPVDMGSEDIVSAIADGKTVYLVYRETSGESIFDTYCTLAQVGKEDILDDGSLWVWSFFYAPTSPPGISLC